MARALLLKGVEKPIRVLCVRELQKSISESVHKVLADQIVKLGLTDFYEVQQAAILGKNGTSFKFEGVKNNVTTIKSYEGIDYCWAEEAVKISKNSWGVLIPTIRKDGSEIWITFNPELETDYTYDNWVKRKDLQPLTPDFFGKPITTTVVYENSDSFVVKMTHKDNEWFPKELQSEMEKCKVEDPDAYMNIWEGNCATMLEGAIYAKELRKAQADGRICSVPYDVSVPVQTFWDLGRADNTAIWFAQRVAMQWRLLEYYEAQGEDITHFIKVLQNREYLYGMHHLPHDAQNKGVVSPLSVEQIIRKHYPKRVRIVHKVPPEDGINAARIIFGNCWFDEERCADGLNALRHYRFKVVNGQYSNVPLHDWASDGADAFRYFALANKRDTSESSTQNVVERLQEAVRRGKFKPANELGNMGDRTGQGWMGH